ncbi:glycerophosphoryl diester phosphodiesterase membrane domain-containing protein [Raineyella fluvialis]|uniref:Glycerophosphoryl diester phosphodiesterase membrane domain-containing protein n=1 Tax=Raineyella fluvialis TaxID=2662261 RepID=A0A5Q2FHC8_9ACTN|nr:glycerophosphoryl diester phosphodiesterase membrane domain-containing protein [Raineyella fluvialis]QGF23736.1 hypothetical protein Rai3103_08700 [Raineyella fluvialis]
MTNPPGQGGPYAQGMPVPPPTWPTLPRHPLNLGEVLSASFRLYGRRFGQLVVIALIPSLVGLVLVGAAAAAMVVAAVRLAGSFTYGPAAALRDTSTLGLLVGGVLLLVVAGIVAGLVQIKCDGMIALAGRDLEDGRPSTVGDLWRRTRGMAVRALALILLLVLAMVVLSATLGVLVVWLTNSDGSGASVGTTVILAIVIVLAAIYLQTRWAFVVQALAIEGAGPLAALGSSWRTTRGAFWRVFGYLLVAGLLVGAVGGAVSGVTNSLMTSRLAGMEAADSLPQLIGQLTAMIPFFLVGLLGSQVVQLLSRPFTVLFTTVLYIDQRRRLGLEILAPEGPQVWGPGYGNRPGAPGQWPASGAGAPPFA